MPTIVPRWLKTMAQRDFKPKNLLRAGSAFTMLRHPPDGVTHGRPVVEREGTALSLSRSMTVDFTPKKWLSVRALRKPRRRIWGESLESRRVLSVVSWDGGAGTANWEDAPNWSDDALPGHADDVQIPAVGT